MKTVTAQLNNIRISPRKMRVVANALRGQKVPAALGYLQYELKKPSRSLQKLIESAVANAEHNHDLKAEHLVIADIQVGAGPTLKRWMPRAYGRASAILKRTSRVHVTLRPVAEKTVAKKTAKKATKKAVARKATKKTARKKAASRKKAS